MESHILNHYHHARYRTTDHKIMHSTSESEGSCNQNSPEYPQEQVSNQYEKESNEREYWNTQNRHLWNENQKINITKSSNNSSIDDEEIIDVQNISVDETQIDSSDGENEADSMEDNSLVEGADYDVIQIFAVDPDLVCSSEDEEQDDEKDDEQETQQDDEQDEDLEGVEIFHNQSNSPDNICERNLDINLDTPVLSNVDDYFIKDKDILAVKDEPVVKDVDEYFIKNINKPKLLTVEENVLETTELSIEPVYQIQQDKVDHIDKLFTVGNVSDNKCELIKDMPESVPDLPIIVSDSVLPNVEELKRYLLEDIPYSKLKNVQRPCSVPHTPMHNLCLEGDFKTCLSFEDLNLDLSDLSFDNCKDKSSNSSKTDDMPRALTEEDVNSFLITPSNAPSITNKDNLIPQDMEIENPLDSIVSSITTPLNIDQVEPIQTIKCNLETIPQINTLMKKQIVDNEPKELLRPLNVTLLPVTAGKACEIQKLPINTESTVFDFCIEKNNKKGGDANIESDDFIDVESCNDTVIPVLEANNVNSLLEQFEATERLNKKTKLVTVDDTMKIKPLTSLTNGTRLKDAGIQLNKNKMRQIMMPSTINTSVKRSPSPVHSDHDYCSTTKRHSIPNIKSGRSLLKPEVLSSNSKILSTRHRSCKNKKILYHQSSDEESEKCTDIKKRNSSIRNNDSDIKIKHSSKESLKKVSSPCYVTNNSDKNNGSVMVKNASKASDTTSSPNCNGTIKLTIKNKSKVIITHNNDKDITKTKTIANCSSVKKPVVQKNKKSSKIVAEKSNPTNKNDYPVADTINEPTKQDDFYATLFKNKQDLQIPINTANVSNKRHYDDIGKISPESAHGMEIEMPQKKKKLNLQEYKLRRENNSNQSSAQVSPEAIFPEIQSNNINLTKEENLKPVVNNKPCNEVIAKIDQKSEAVNKIFDPIREASRKILINKKKSKAEASRKRDEDFIKSKIPKVHNFELPPLMSDDEMMKIVSKSAEAIFPVAIPIPNEVVKKHKNYDEIILVSVATNTDANMFKSPIKEVISEITKNKMSPPKDNKSTINFKIKKCDNLLKQNVFETVRIDRSVKDSNEIKLDEERYKGITATLKSVEKQVDTKISSNSLFASIQDVVMKKASTVQNDNKQKCSSTYKKECKSPKITIVRDYDANTEHGEDKVILHLEKSRSKPEAATVTIQTDYSEAYKPLTFEIIKQDVREVRSISPRRRNDSDMSMSTESSPERKLYKPKSEERPKDMKREKSYIEEKMSRSKDRHINYRLHSRGHRRHRSRSRSRSRSRGRFMRYRRSDSPFRKSDSPYNKSDNPYRRKKRTRTPYRSPIRRDYGTMRSRYAESKSTVIKKSPSNIEKKPSFTPPIRKSTASESSESTSASSSSSSSTNSSTSSDSRRDTGTFRRKDSRPPYRTSYSSEDRESNTPVEERRIVFVGRLEPSLTQASLRSKFSMFGPVTEVRLHNKEDGSRYGFVTFQRPRDAWTAVESAKTFPQYDVGFGGRRAFCRQIYADLDGLEAKYTESAFHGQTAAPPRRGNDLSFEQMLLDVRNKLNKRKSDSRSEDTA